MTVVIYNPASIDSTISAAVVSRALNANAIPTGKISTFLGNLKETYHWVGVIPSEESVATLKGTHTVFHMNRKAKLPKGVMMQASLIPQEGIEEPDIPVFDTLMGEMVSYRAQLIGNITPTDWQLLALYVKEFEDGKRGTSLMEQASVWQFYQASIAILNRSGAYTLKPLGKELLDDYLSFLKHVKSRVEKVVVIRTIEVRGSYEKVIKVPVMNINQEIMPWALKLARNAYRAAAAFELCGNLSIYAISCQERNVVEGIAKWLSEPHIRMSDAF